ncbi:hypothetical protein ACFC3O_00710 [Streptomyces sp. NPDC056007]|uniref:hypothetical protein n=1 Tax=Streptomyces sp. NPDC056007 TaxID=3345678 RepID=UPI0035DF8796
MAEINPPAWMQAGSYPARTDRLILSALLSYPGFAVDEPTPTRIRQGIKPSYQNYQLKARAAPTPNMTVIVSAGFCFIDNHDSGGLGTYVCVNDGDKTLTVQPAGGAGQYRRDCVVASVYDAETAGSANEWRLEVIQGAYAASAGAAVRPSLPPNCSLIADLTIGPSQSSVAAGQIFDVRNFSVAAGGILPVSSTIAPPRLHPGQTLYLTNLDKMVYGRLDGTTADLVPKATAWSPITLSGAWVPNGATGDSAPSARITHDGTLELSGMARGVAIGAGSNAAFGTLPASLIPLVSYWVRGVAATSVSQDYVRVAVDPSSGSIALVNGSVAIGTGAWIQLDGVRGRAS